MGGVWCLYACERARVCVCVCEGVSVVLRVFVFR